MYILQGLLAEQTPQVRDVSVLGQRSERASQRCKIRETENAIIHIRHTVIVSALCVLPGQKSPQGCKVGQRTTTERLGTTKTGVAQDATAEPLQSSACKHKNCGPMVCNATLVAERIWLVLPK
jgi:hypothetical protein